MSVSTVLLGLLPAMVSVNTPQQAVTTHYNFALHEGVVFWKANPDYLRECQCTPEAPVEWEALPTPDADQGMNYQAISADEHFLLLQTASNQLWRLDLRKKEMSKDWGLPVPVKVKDLVFQTQLGLPSYADKFVYSIRHKDVAYYEDPKGNQFHWGSAGCTTVFTLNKDQQTISWGDPWFPPDLSRQLCGPVRGKKKLLGLASSASVTMVLTSDGEIWTRFYDYDSNGGTPFFTYAYGEKAPVHNLTGAHRKSEFKVRGLPAEEWQKHPELPLLKGAKLSKNLSVLQTGEGNHARELRIQAVNESGQSGFYYKGLKDSAWSFRVTHEYIAESDLIRPEAAGKFYPNKDRSYQGSVIEKGRPIAEVSTADMNFHCTPISMNYQLPSGESFEILLHTVDAWSPFRDEDPEFNPAFVKKLKVTLELPPETLKHPSQQVQAFLKKRFKKDHLKAFRWMMVVNQDRAELRRASYPFRMKAKSTEKLVMRLSSSDALKDDIKATKTDITHNELAARHKFNRKLQNILPGPLLLADFLSVLTTVRFTVPEVSTLPSLESHLGSVLLSNELGIMWMKELPEK